MKQLDHINAIILAERIIAWNKINKPRVGDFCIMPDGDYRRFTYHHGDRIQTTCRGDGESFYFGEGGYADYSGPLDPAISISKITRTEEKKEGRFWFFHHDNRRAFNSVQVTVRCRVWKVT